MALEDERKKLDQQLENDLNRFDSYYKKQIKKMDRVKAAPKINENLRMDNLYVPDKDQSGFAPSKELNRTFYGKKGPQQSESETSIIKEASLIKTQKRYVQSDKDAVEKRAKLKPKFQSKVPPHYPTLQAEPENPTIPLLKYTDRQGQYNQVLDKRAKSFRNLTFKEQWAAKKSGLRQAIKMPQAASMVKIESSPYFPFEKLHQSPPADGQYFAKFVDGKQMFIEDKVIFPKIQKQNLLKRPESPESTEDMHSVLNQIQNKFSYPE